MGCSTRAALGPSLYSRSCGPNDIYVFYELRPWEPLRHSVGARASLSHLDGHLASLLYALGGSMSYMTLQDAHLRMEDPPRRF